MPPRGRIDNLVLDKPAGPFLAFFRFSPCWVNRTGGAGPVRPTLFDILGRMAEIATVSHLLDAQPERKLRRLRDGILAEITRLQDEMRLVESALERKRSAHTPAVSTRPVGPHKANGGRFEGLAREELLRHVQAVGHPVTAPEMREILESKGIVRKTEAIRTGLARLVAREQLVRLSTGRFAVPNANGNGDRVEAQTGPSSQTSLNDGYPPERTDG
jgi:hypothetical protein